MDEIVGHMRERIDLPEDYGALPTVSRKAPTVPPEEYFAYRDVDGSGVPPMAAFGSGYRWHVSGLIHDETGFPKGTPAATKSSMDCLRGKLVDHMADIVTAESYRMEDAEIAVVAFGGAARSAYDAVDMARDEGIKAGLWRPVTIWPFPEEEVQALAQRVKHILVHELNCGQYVREVERAVAGRTPVHRYAKYDNESAAPEELLAQIKKAMEGAD